MFPTVRTAATKENHVSIAAAGIAIVAVVVVAAATTTAPLVFSPLQLVQ